MSNTRLFLVNEDNTEILIPAVSIDVFDHDLKVLAEQLEMAANMMRKFASIAQLLDIDIEPKDNKPTKDRPHYQKFNKWNEK